MMTALYFHEMRVDPANPKWEDRDRFVLSKGHVCPVLYTALMLRGFFPMEEVHNLRKKGSILQGHPDMKRTPGVDISTGSLGQGLSTAVGMAIAARRDGKTLRVFTMLGDGECNEGQIWEAAQSASKYRLDNLVVLVDNNTLQNDGICDVIMPTLDLAAKFRAFGFDVQEIDGHCMNEVVSALHEARRAGGQAQMHRGPYRQGQGRVLHGKCRDVAWGGAGCRTIPAGHCGNRRGARMNAIATRDAFGHELLDMGNKYDNLYVVDCDIGKSCKTVDFQVQFPQKHLNVGIAEQNAAGVAAGLATMGKVPFVSTYAVFGSMRMLEQIRQEACYPNLNVKIACSHGGLTPANDGASHQCIEDMGILRSIPNMTVIMPADYWSARKLIDAAYHYPGPVYLRFTRDPIPVIYTEDDTFEIGKSRELIAGTDAVIIANGDIMSFAMKACEELKAEGIFVRLIDMHTIKPLDVAAVVKAVEDTGKIVTIEDHNIMNGLGSAVAEVIAELGKGKMKRMGVQDQFGESGPYELLLADNGVTVENIKKTIKDLL
jgi:transketolase